MGEVIQMKASEIRMKEIEDLTTSYASDYNEFAQVKRDIDNELAKIKTKYGVKMNQLSQSLADKGAALQESLLNNPDLFEKPKTRVFAGIKVGFRKGKDTIEILNEEATIKRIEENFTKDKAETLIKTDKSVIKGSLSTLSDEELVKIGCEKKSGEDSVVIASIESAVDKFITALYKQDAA